MKTLRELFEHQLRETYSLEHRLVQALQDMADESALKDVKHGFTQHKKEVQKQLERLAEACDRVGLTPTPGPAPSLEGILKERDHFLSTAPTDELLDCYHLQLCWRLVHYHIANAEVLIETAERLHLQDVAHLLRASLQEERGALTRLRALTRDFEVTSHETGGLLQPAPGSHNDPNHPVAR